MHWTCIAGGQCREGLDQAGGDVFMFSSTSDVEMEEPGQDIWLSKEHRKHQCCPPPSCASPGRQAASAGDLQFVFPRCNHESTTSRITPLSTARLLVAPVDSRPRAKHRAHLCCCRLPGCVSLDGRMSFTVSILLVNTEIYGGNGDIMGALPIPAFTWLVEVRSQR